MRILIVDDDTQMIALLKAVVEVYSKRKDNKVDVVCSAEKALMLFEPGKYDLIVTDLRLQEMNGLELCLEIRKQDKKVVIVALTGFYNPIFKFYDGALAGFNRVFEKGNGYHAFIEYLKDKIKI